MEQIIVYKHSGQVIRLFSNGKVTGITKAEQVCDLLGQDVVNIAVSSSEPLPFEIGDYIEIFGSRYHLNLPPKKNKVHESLFQYELKFEGVQYELIKVQYLDVDALGFSTGTNFTLMGNLEDFARLLIRNAARIYGEDMWILGEFPADTETQNMSFNNQTCLQVLQDLCEKYEQAFFIDRIPENTYIVHFRKPETTMDEVFKYGRTKGLYNLQENAVSGKNVITRLYAYGSTKNLPSNYRSGSPRLKMPVSYIYSEGLPYIEDAAAADLYGNVEGAIVFEDIYPQRTGTVTGIDYSNPLVFFDASMPFDLTATGSDGESLYLLPGLTAKVVFKTGALAGYEFDINSEGGYIHSERKFKIITYTDDRGAEFPSPDSDVFRIQPGDTYVLTDIAMPESYITDAENRLLVRAQDYLAQNSIPHKEFTLTVDQNYIISRTPAGPVVNYFKLGDYLKVEDADLQINGKVPIQGFIRNILNHYEYKLTLGEEYISRKGPISRLRAIIEGARLIPATSSTRRYYSTTIETTEVTTSRWGATEW